MYVGSGDGKLYAVKAGSLKWSCPTGSGIWYSSPAIGADGVVYVGNDYYLNAIKPDGTLKWSYLTVDSVTSPAIGVDGTVKRSFDDAQREYEAALKLKPDFEDARYNLQIVVNVKDNLVPSR